MSKGIVIVALGDKYCEMALNLCLSIRANKSSDIEIMLLHQGLPASVSTRSSFFTHCKDISDRLKDYHVNLHRAMYAKLLAYELSPFEETILLDADTIMLPGKGAAALFSKCEGDKDFLAMTTGFYERGGKSSDKYTWWVKDGKPEPAMNHFMVPTNNILPQINASFLFFRKSVAAERLFSTALRVWKDKTFTGYVEHHRSKTEEFCINMACAIEGLYPAPEPSKVFYPVFITMHHQNWTEETLYHGYAAFSLAGSELGNENDYRLARFYNKLVAYYRRAFGIAADFVLTSDAKNRIPSKDIKVVGYWHVMAANNWGDVVCEQMAIISNSGLYDRLELIKVSFVGNAVELDSFRKLMRYYKKVEVVYYTTDAKVFEFPALDLIKADADKTEKEFYGFYFHTKGVTKQRDSCKTWRNYLNHYNLRLWKKSICALDAGYELAGCNWLLAQNTWEDHFSGNFFWFRTNYIKFLPPILSLKRDNRYEAEMWVGKAGAKVYEISRKEVNAPDTKKFFPMRKIGVFVSGNLKNENTQMALNMLAMSGLLPEAETAIGCFTPKDTVGNIIPKDSFFNRVEEYAALGTAVDKAQKHMFTWCGENPDGIALLLCIPHFAITEMVMQKLVIEWEACYNRIVEGYESVGLVVHAGPKKIYAGNCFWMLGASDSIKREEEEINFHIEGNSYYRLPVIIHESDVRD